MTDQAPGGGEEKVSLSSNQIEGNTKEEGNVTMQNNQGQSKARWQLGKRFTLQTS